MTSFADRIRDEYEARKERGSMSYEPPKAITQDWEHPAAYLTENLRRNKTMNKPKVFLGGTCNGSTWRDNLIPQLNIDYFNPVIADWNEEAQKREIAERENADFVLYVITPAMKGVYSIAEVVDDSNKRPEKTILAILPSDAASGEVISFDKTQTNSLSATARLVESNGAKICGSLEEVAEYLNGIPLSTHEEARRNTGAF
jgi:Nucleoside 2-deoxyribosyltransferase like